MWFIPVLMTQIGQEHAGGEDAKANRESPSGCGDFEANGVGRGQIHEQRRADQFAARKVKAAREFPVDVFVEYLRESLEDAELDEGKPVAEI